MKNLYRLFVPLFLVLLFLGWMLNCTGFDSTNIQQQVTPVNIKDIQYSTWVNAQQWTNTNIFGLPAKSYEIQNNQLNNSVLEAHQLYVYAKINDEVRPLPFTQTTETGEQRFDYTLLPNNTLKLVIIGLKGNVVMADQQSFRYILIPNTLAHKLTVDMNDYENVGDSFKLED